MNLKTAMLGILPFLDDVDFQPSNPIDSASYEALEKEYELIKQKKSKLSASQRRYLVKRFETIRGPKK